MREDNVDRVRLGSDVHEVPDEAGAVAIFVEAPGVGAHHAPATALIEGAVSAHQEAVANVAPAVGVHVEILNGPDDLGATIKVVTVGSL